MSFWGELKRRNVYKVGVAYAIVAWLLIQFAAIAFPHLDFPSWAVPFVIIILIIGFPVVLIIAWAFEVTPEGIKRTKEVPLSESITHITSKKLNYILAGLLILAVAYIVFARYYFPPSITETTQVPAVNEDKEVPKTIAVLPFDDLSPEKDQEYFVLGLSEEILNSLAQIPDLLVTARTSSFAFKGTDKMVQDIAEVLGVAHVLEGSVRKVGNTLRIAVQLIRASDGFHIWSKTYDRELKDILAVQEDIATTVADELMVTLGIGKSFKQLGGTENLEAYELYLIAQGQIINRDLATLNRAQELIDEAIALDPEFALAWSFKANIHILKIVFGPPNLADSEIDEGLYAAQKSIELEANLPEAYSSLGAVNINRGEWIEAESDFRKAFQLSTESVLADVGQSIVHYLCVSNFKRVHELLEEMRRKDPLNLSIRQWYIYSLNLMGDTHRAQEEYERCRELFGNQWEGIGWYVESKTRPGVRLPVPLDEIPETVVPYRFFTIAWEHFGSPEKGLIELHRIYEGDENLNSAEIITISWCAAYLGDSEFALESMEKAYYINPSNAFHFWTPVMHEVRQTPRFKEFLKDIGLVDYWNEFGWPDICRPLDNGDFECD